jgi:hypothetical protein
MFDSTRVDHTSAPARGKGWSPAQDPVDNIGGESHGAATLCCRRGLDHAPIGFADRRRWFLARRVAHARTCRGV